MSSNDLEFEQFCVLMEQAEVIGVDTESNGKEIRDGRGYAMGLSVAFRYENLLFSTYMPFKHDGFNYKPERLYRVGKILENAPLILCHNAKFDIVSLATLGIWITDNFLCTMLMVHLLDENVPDKSLEYTSRLYLSDGGKRKEGLGEEGWEDRLAGEVFEYARWDAVLALLLYEALLAQWNIEGLQEFWKIQKGPFTQVLKTMESRGVEIDMLVCTTEWLRGKARMAEISTLLQGNPASPIFLEKMLINTLGLPAVAHTPAGKISFNKQAMEQYEEMLGRLDDPRATLILEYRGWQKTVSSNYQAYVSMVSPDGRLRPNYKQHGTVTGRLSCERPNLQQIPRVSDKDWNGHLKSAFVAMEGFSLWEADFSQLELRLASAYAKEEGLLKVFAEGRDIFNEMSADLSMARHDTKTLTYTIQYGGGITRISNVFGVTKDRANAIRENFYRKYPGFRKLSTMASSRCKNQGYITLWSGRRRHFRNPSEESHKAFNSVIQGGSADIMERVGIRLFAEVDNSEECRMILQIHDSYVFEIRNDRVEQYLPLIKAVMEDVQPDFGVRFAVDIHKWGE